ncbi:MAG: hypothetical protein K2Y10_11445 [Burkholderiaceae bacterium]|nr:hypothetical protein [Burkholderiaceae bacterium]
MKIKSTLVYGLAKITQPWIHYFNDILLFAQEPEVLKDCKNIRNPEILSLEVLKVIANEFLCIFHLMEETSSVFAENYQFSPSYLERIKKRPHMIDERKAVEAFNKRRDLLLQMYEQALEQVDFHFSERAKEIALLEENIRAASNKLEHKKSIKLVKEKKKQPIITEPEDFRTYYGVFNFYIKFVKDENGNIQIVYH